MLKNSLGFAAAIAVIGFATNAFAISTQQGPSPNGMNMQGINLQGTQMQGEEEQGAQLQGIEMQGEELQGRQMQGIETKSRKLTHLHSPLVVERIILSTGEKVDLR